MFIEKIKDNIFHSEAEVYVNTVNCVGVSGKGLALQFKKVFPSNYDYYVNCCNQKLLKPGSILVYETGSDFPFGPKYIVNFATKNNWKHQSEYRWIETGLVELVQWCKDKQIKSIAIPALGCTNGKLDWIEVRFLIKRHFSILPEITVELYSPVA